MTGSRSGDRRQGRSCDGLVRARTPVTVPDATAPAPDSAMLPTVVAAPIPAEAADPVALTTLITAQPESDGDAKRQSATPMSKRFPSTMQSCMSSCQAKRATLNSPRERDERLKTKSPDKPGSPSPSSLNSAR